MLDEVRTPTKLEKGLYRFPNKTEDLVLFDGYYIPRTPMKYKELSNNHHNIHLYTKEDIEKYNEDLKNFVKKWFNLDFSATFYNK